MQLEHILQAHGLIGSGGGKSKDDIPPPPITNFNATIVGDTIKLTWTNPNDSDFIGLLIIEKNGSQPAGISDGSIVLNENIEDGGAIPTELIDSNVTLGTRKYYRAFPYDFDKNYQTDTGQQTSAIIKATQTKPNAPTMASRTSTSITLNSINGCEYRIGTGVWQDSAIFSGLSIATSYTFYARKKETDTHLASPISDGAIFTTDKGTQSAPNAPTVTNIQFDRATIDGGSGTEVRIGTGAWFNSPHTFIGLIAETEHMAYARLKETETHFMSDSSIAKVFSTPSEGDDPTDSPGPKLLLGGDMNAGYFGIVPASELFTGTELASLCGITGGTSQFSSEGWLKFAIDGKIIFKSKKTIRHSISWNHIDSKGCVKGTKTVTKGGHTYKVRLMKGALTDPSRYDLPDKGAKRSEWNKLMLPIHIKAKDKSWAYPDNVETDIPYWGIDFTDADLQTHNSHGDGSYHWCQEVSNDNPAYRVFRGGGGVSGSSRGTSSNTNAYYGWSPVLEWVS